MMTEREREIEFGLFLFTLIDLITSYLSLSLTDLGLFTSSPSLLKKEMNFGSMNSKLHLFKPKRVNQIRYIYNFFFEKSINFIN